MVEQKWNHQPLIDFRWDSYCIPFSIANLRHPAKKINSLLVSRYSLWYQKTKGSKYPSTIDLVSILNPNRPTTVYKAQVIFKTSFVVGRLILKNAIDLADEATSLQLQHQLSISSPVLPRVGKILGPTVATLNRHCIPMCCCLYPPVLYMWNPFLNAHWLINWIGFPK